MPSTDIHVDVNLETIRRNTERVAQEVGVPLLAVVKADAYGLGAGPIAAAIGDLVRGFCVFSLREAVASNLWDVAGKPILCLVPREDETAEDFITAHVRPAVWNVEQATRLRAAKPALAVDTGMQRFACPDQNVQAVLEAGAGDEAFTHATHLAQVDLLRKLVGDHKLTLHAAGSSLLHEPRAHLDAVRPGIALFRSATTVTARILDARDSNRPAGYSGFVTPRLGIIRCGYRHGLRRGPCRINGSPRQILEVGMQSAFVELGESDRIGDQVFLLGDGLTEAQVAHAWGTGEHEALLRLSRLAVV